MTRQGYKSIVRAIRLIDRDRDKIVNDNRLNDDMSVGMTVGQGRGMYIYMPLSTHNKYYFENHFIRSYG